MTMGNVYVWQKSEIENIFIGLKLLFSQSNAYLKMYICLFLT